MAGQSNNPVSPMGGVKAFACRSCGGQVELRAPGQTLSAVCAHCGAVADLTDPNFRIISQVEASRVFDPIIPFGRRGKLEGITWECIGAVLRQAEGYDFFWQEYLLFNPYHGFRFLVNNHGHWSLVHMLVDHPENPSNAGFTYDGHKYKHFTSGNARVAGVMGEFYWKVAYNDVAATSDFVSPPYMLSVEVEDGGMIWSQGEYLVPSVVQQAFAIEGEMPKPYAPGMNQPNPHAASARWMTILGVAGIVLALVFQVLFSTMSPSQKVFEQTLTLNAPNDSLVSPVFNLPYDIGNAKIIIDAPGINNAWFEVEGYLHNKETLENYGVGVAVEYYAGVSDGEGWSEGSRQGEIVLNEVPGGKYELVLSTASQDAVGATISVERNAVIFTNLWILIAILIIPPGIFIYFSKRFETQRWAES